MSASHPFVAVMQPKDVPEGVPTSIEGPRGFVAVACCKECHENSEHRVRPLKAHFFSAQDAAAAIFHAGSNTVGGA
jgi:hypothetical protein